MWTVSLNEVYIFHLLSEFNTEILGHTLIDMSSSMYFCVRNPPHRKHGENILLWIMTYVYHLLCSAVRQKIQIKNTRFSIYMFGFTRISSVININMSYAQRTAMEIGNKTNSEQMHRTKKNIWFVQSAIIIAHVFGEIGLAFALNCVEQKWLLTLPEKKMCAYNLNRTSNFM